jgi:hypothetical protein
MLDVCTAGFAVAKPLGIADATAGITAAPPSAINPTKAALSFIWSSCMTSKRQRTGWVSA